MTKRFRETFIVVGVALTAIIGIQLYIYVRNKQIDFMQCFFYAFLGIIGGDF